MISGRFFYREIDRNVLKTYNKYMFKQLEVLGKIMTSMLANHIQEEAKIIKNLGRYLIISALAATLTACSLNDLDFKAYTEGPLSIAVIGEEPDVVEEHVRFEEITLDDLAEDEIDSYNAVFIMGDKLIEASSEQHAETYLNSEIPVFFVSAQNTIPFTEKDLEYDRESWGWEEGVSYISGLYRTEDENGLTRIGFGLYNEEMTEETLQATFSLVFSKIAELQ